MKATLTIYHQTKDDDDDDDIVQTVLSQHDKDPCQHADGPNMIRESYSLYIYLPFLLLLNLARDIPSTIPE